MASNPPQPTPAEAELLRFFRVMEEDGPFVVPTGECIAYGTGDALIRAGHAHNAGTLPPAPPWIVELAAEARAAGVDPLTLLMRRAMRREVVH